jgi:hypothetical protein
MKSVREVRIAKLRKYLRACVLYEKKNRNFWGASALEEDLRVLNKFAALEDLSSVQQQPIDLLLEKYKA